MRTATTLIAGLGMSASVAPMASGDFVGLAVAMESANQSTPAGPRDVYHVFAQFNNSTDRVDSWFGSSSNPFVIQNVLADSTTLGSGFQQFGGAGGQFAPKDAGSVRDWDTYATIGIRFGTEADPFGGDATMLTDFPIFITGNVVVSSVGVASLQPVGAPQGRADFRVTGNDTNLHVLLMQLTVQVGEHVRGTLNISGQVATPTGMQSFTLLGQTFNSVPGPGPLACMTLGTLMLGRKRRRCVH